MKRCVLKILPAAVLLSAASAAFAQSAFDISGADHWVDTKIALKPGDQIDVTATGSLTWAPNGNASPDGMPRGFRDLLRSYPVNSAGRGALVGRIGATDADQPFLIGAGKRLEAFIGGNLFLGINQEENDQADGSFHVTVTLTRGSHHAANARVPKLTQAMLDRIPTRVEDKNGDPGDRVNFLIVGSEDDMRQAFGNAGWVKVDRTKAEAILNGLILSLAKQAYLQMPMSELYLFGRPQDYGFAHAEPIQVAQQRHHLRVWQADFKVEGQSLWVGAATHDIGFERDARNNGITHRIDPDVDLEREYLRESLMGTGMVAEAGYLVPAHPVKEARTATGGSFHSDGRTLVLYLQSLQ